MSSQIAKFIHGIDLSDSYHKGSFPSACLRLTLLRWIKLNRLELKEIPFEIRVLKCLESIQLKGNRIKSMKNRIVDMKHLWSLNLSTNELHTNSFSADLKLPNLSVLDVSSNQLENIPEALLGLSSLVTLNLSNNRLKYLPPELFLSSQNLLHLNISRNKIEIIPPQIRRLHQLRFLDASDNPLFSCQIRQLNSLKNLKCLNFSNTGRNDSNLMNTLDAQTKLICLNISKNEVCNMPLGIFRLKNMTELNMSDCKLDVIDSSICTLIMLRNLNVARNRLKYLPVTIIQLVNLQRLYVDSNQLTFDGIPAGFANLAHLKVLSFCDNRIETIPEEICRCSQLRILRLAHNRLISLPSSIYLLNLELLDVRGNTNLQMSSSKLYQPPSVPYDLSPFEYKKTGSSGSHSKRISGNVCASTPDVIRSVQTRTINQPKLNFSNCFDRNVGTKPGVECWELDKLAPNRINQDFFGTFYSNDCYIILHTWLDTFQNVQNEIYFWIGKGASLDKRTCAAMYAVNLRHILGCTCRTNRQEQDHETERFRQLFDNKINCIDGQHGESCFRAVYADSGSYDFDVQQDLQPMSPRALILCGQKDMEIRYAPVKASSFFSDAITLIDTNNEIRLWNGKLCNSFIVSKARLFAQTINAFERKNMAEILQLDQNSEDKAFWTLLESDEISSKQRGTECNKSADGPLIGKTPPIIYKITFDRGYIDLPQPIRRSIHIDYRMLRSQDVYLCDCFGELYIWIGRRSVKIARIVSLLLAKEIMGLFPRPVYYTIRDVQEGREPVILRYFLNNISIKPANDVLESKVTNRGDFGKQLSEAIKSKSSEKRSTKDFASIGALTLPRAVPMSWEEANSVEAYFNEDLVNDPMDAFVFDGRKFIRLAENQYGIFHTNNCYIYIARYWKRVPADKDLVLDENSPIQSSLGGCHNRIDSKPNTVVEGESDHDADVCEENQTCESETEQILYFWQGREAGNTAWFFFNFQLKKRFEETLATQFKVTKLSQQRETITFLAHFRNRIIINQGNIFDNKNYCSRLYEIRWAFSPICTRCIQLPTRDHYFFISSFCYIITIVNSTDLYLWIGANASEDDANCARTIALIISKDAKLIEIYESDLIPDSIVSTFGLPTIVKDIDFVHKKRLFKCSNEEGHFKISEKWSDFCQDDLEQDDVMILDSGRSIFIWVGEQASETELKDTFKAAQYYHQHLILTNDQPPRKIKFCGMNKENDEFKQCFHGWTDRNRNKHRNTPIMNKL